IAGGPVRTEGHPHQCHLPGADRDPIDARPPERREQEACSAQPDTDGPLRTRGGHRLPRRLPCLRRVDLDQRCRPRGRRRHHVKLLLMLTTQRPTRLRAGGSWRPGEGEKTFDVVEPATSDVMARAAVASPADVDAAVKAARAAFEAGSWSNAAASARARVLYKIADLIRSDRKSTRLNSSH